MPARRLRILKFDAAMMAAACRKIARDLRVEAAFDLPPIELTHLPGWTTPDTHPEHYITRAEAALRFDEQAERWEHEALTGIPNRTDRDKINM